jgi:hypothetical protein
LIIIDIIELIRTSFSTVGVYGGCFGLSRDILHLFYIEKQGMAMRLEAAALPLSAIAPDV